jgi:hypothetical protein
MRPTYFSLASVRVGLVPIDPDARIWERDNGRRIESRSFRTRIRIAPAS